MRTAIAALVLLGACATPVQPRHAAPRSVVAAHREATPAPVTELVDFAALLAQERAGWPAGVLVKSGWPDDTMPPVDPVDVALAELPEVAMPARLARQPTPTELPPAVGDSPLRVRSLGVIDMVDEVALSVEAPYARIEVGRDNFMGNARAYLKAEPPFIRAVRLHRLGLDARGRAELVVTDAWVDLERVEASVVAETVIHPRPLLGGLMLAYRDARTGVITVLAPPVSWTGPLATLGGEAVILPGNGFDSFTLLQLPIRPGSTSHVGVRVSANDLEGWFSATGRQTPSTAIFLGLDLGCSPSSGDVLALAYATLTPGVYP